MKGIVLSYAWTLLVVLTGCIQLNIPDSPGNQTMQYTLVLPSQAKTSVKNVAVTEFSSESPAKFKMLSRQGTVQQFDSFAKWSQTPSVMVSSAFRKIYGIDDDVDAEYLLEGDILTFERNLDKKTADLRIVYSVVKRSDRKVIFRKELSSSVPLKGDTPAAFAEAMSKAVIEQAEAIRKNLDTLK
ncbi:MAG: membrane integrity-associated transporter subunit PqiC [Lentisphaeria bacterium]|nr:membrane integrity-associated transporter subunit PqiC [Lentisphaeria bacterium]